LNEVLRELSRLTAAAGREELARPDLTPAVANRAAGYVAHLRQVVADWYAFYGGYDPMVTWWAAEPYKRLDAGLAAYAEALRRHLVGIVPGEIEPIVGDPVLADGLRADLAVEMIPYTADELIAISEREFGWVEEQFRNVAREMGYADDWKAALEHVKTLAPPPGEKP
jgi:hypothetical protein